ncbi:MAG: T9SS type A sorting domain-containing protein [Sphingobacteriales bacterium]
MKKYLLLLYIGLTVAGSKISAAPLAAGYDHIKRQPFSAKKTNLYLANMPGICFLHAGSHIADTVPHLRLQLYKDSLTTDDTYIGFEAGASTSYVINQDAKYFQGYGAISLASISGDGVKLAINRLPLPAQSETIRLYATAKTSGAYRLNTTEDEGIPALYDVWLMDAYEKDSLDLRQNPAYSFNISKADTNSFGSKRFSLVIRQNPALTFHLLAFTAVKAAGGVQISWKTENEQGYTNFTVERSNDGGQTYDTIDSLLSSSLGAYSYLDKSPSNATDQYRLKIRDLNGCVSYSAVVELLYSTTGIAHASINIYPNPARTVVNFEMVSGDVSGSSLAGTQNMETGSYNIKIINLSGTVIRSGTTNTKTWQTDVSNLLPGTYIVQMIKDNSSSEAGKSTFIKL